MQNLEPSLVFPNPTFSLGLTQEPPVEGGRQDTVPATTVPQASDEELGAANIDDPGVECRKTKRQKVPTKILMGEYQCDKSFLNRARQAVADAIYKGRNIDYAEKFSALLDKMKTSL